MNTRRKKILVLSMLLGLLVLIGLAGGYFFSLPRQFAVVDAGILYRGGQGRSFEFQNVIRRHHIKTIVCLRDSTDEKDDSWAEAEQKVTRRNKVDLIYCPIDSDHPLPEKKILEFLNLTQNPAKTPILVHCALGKHRTGVMVAAYRMVINNWSFGRSIKEMDSFGFGLDTHPRLLDSLRKIDPEQIRRTAGLTVRPEKSDPGKINLLLAVSLWTLFGFVGQFFFFSRFMVQWIATEKRGRTHIPVAFWYFSLLGGVILTVYAVGKRDIVITMGQGLGCLIYIRNLMIIKRNQGKVIEVKTNGR